MAEREENLHVMRVLDEQDTRTPFYGTRTMTAWLNTQGYPVESKRVTRLLRLMGLEAISPQPHLRIPGVPEQKYPYWLRGLRGGVVVRRLQGKRASVLLPGP